MYERYAFMLQVVIDPFGPASGHWAMPFVFQGLPWYFPQEGPAFGTNIIYLELIVQFLQLPGDFGRLASAHVYARHRRQDRQRQTQSHPQMGALSRIYDNRTDDSRQSQRQGLKQPRLKLVGRLYPHFLFYIVIIYRLKLLELFTIIILAF